MAETRPDMFVIDPETGLRLNLYRMLNEARADERAEIAARVAALAHQNSHVVTKDLRVAQGYSQACADVLALLPPAVPTLDGSNVAPDNDLGAP